MKHNILPSSYVLILFVIQLFTSSGCSTNSGVDEMNQGVSLYLDGDLEEAKVYLLSALSKELVDEDRKAVMATLGNLYSDLDAYDSAIYYQKQAISVDPEYVDAWVNMGIAHRLNGDYDKAEESYREAMKLNPLDPELQASLGALYIFKNDVPLALQHLERAIALDHQLPVAHSNYALALAMDGQYEKAEEELRIAVTMGYQNGAIIKERIEGLKSIDE